MSVIAKIEVSKGKVVWVALDLHVVRPDGSERIHRWIRTGDDFDTRNPRYIRLDERVEPNCEYELWIAAQAVQPGDATEVELSLIFDDVIVDQITIYPGSDSPADRGGFISFQTA